MTKNEFALVLCRLLGLYFILSFFYGMGQVVVMIFILREGGNIFGGQLFLNTVIPHFFGLAIGAIVWVFAPRISERMAA